MRKLFALAAMCALFGCAKAGIGNSNDDGDDSSDDSTDSTGDDSDDSTPGPDAPRVDAPPPIDAMEPDAAPIRVTLAQTDMTIASGRSIACGATDGTSTSENSWYRVFDMNAAGVTGPLAITEVAFGIETSNAAQSIDVKIGTYTGALNGTSLSTASIQPLAAMTVNVGAVTAQMQSVPIVATAPAGSLLVVEIRAADGEPTGSKFYLGTSAAAESSPAYIRAPDCDVLTPTSIASVAPTGGTAIIQITGTYN